MSQIKIIGAGISGLVLGRILLRNGVRAVIFEKDASQSRHNYGITLHPWAYRPLLKLVDLDESAFKKQVAVDARIGGHGQLSGSGTSGNTLEDLPFRANRQTLAALLSEGLDIRWDHQLVAMPIESSSKSLVFRNGERVPAAVVVGADGVHSSLRAKAVSPKTEFSILPFAVYNGKRRVNKEVFSEKYAEYMDGANVIESKEGQTLMQISINDRTDDLISIGYTYSRPAQRGDAIFDPDRTKGKATDIPNELFEEIAALSNLGGPFEEVFDVAKMRDDRMLNWLMRSVSVDASYLRSAAAQGIILMGDSVHACNILGGDGANDAIKDGIELAEFILEHGTNNLAPFYSAARTTRWRESVRSSEDRLARIHGATKASL